MFNVYEITKGRRLTAVNAADLAPDWSTDDIVRWIRMTSPEGQELAAILGAVELPDGLLQPGQGGEVRTQVNVRGRFLFISLPILVEGAGRLAGLGLICTATTLITIQWEEHATLDSLAADLQDDEELMEGGLATLVLETFGAAVQNVSPQYFALRKDVDKLAAALEAMPSDVSMDAIVELQHRTTQLSMLLEDHLYCHAELQRCRLQTPWLAVLRQHAHDHIAGLERASTLLSRVEDRLRVLRQHYLDNLQEGTNRRLNLLAVLSAIYLPPTLIAGIYGMNFEDIPITHIPHGYGIVMSVMAAVVLGQFWYFYRRGWFK